MIYLDNASTTFPKPAVVDEAVSDFIRNYAVNPGRGNYQLAQKAATIIEEARFTAADFFGVKNPERIAFTLNATDGLNAAIKGYVRPADRVITTNIEHNAVLRPLMTLAEKNSVRVEYIPSDKNGIIPTEEMKKAIAREKTRLVVMTYASNVYGVIQEGLLEIVGFCHKNNTAVLFDGSQVAGHIRIDIEKLGIDMFATSGHKGLYGPPGTGLLYIKDGIELAPWREGGSGEGLSRVKSSELKMPLFIETGTQNNCGIAGLGAAIKFVKENFSDIEKHTRKLTSKIIDGLSSLKDIEILGLRDVNHKVPVVSFVVKKENFSARAFAMALDSGFGICVRGGEHCAPLLHKDFDYEKGTVRVSPGFFNTESDVEKFIEAVKKLLN